MKNDRASSSPDRTGGQQQGGPSVRPLSEGRSLRIVTAAQIASASTGFIQTLIVVRTLGVNGYGDLAVLASLVGIAANALDLRVADVVTRLHYSAGLPSGEGSTASRLELLLGGIVTQVGVGLGVAALTLGAAWLYTLVSSFHLPPWTVLSVYAISEGLVVRVTNLIAVMQRLSERFVFTSIVQVVSSLGRTAIVVAAVHLQPDLRGAVLGLAVASSLTLVLHLGTSAWLDSPSGAPSARRSVRLRSALAPYWRERRLLGSLATVNYQNLLHRTADVLVVGALGGESVAGLYRFARTTTDTAYVLLYDGANRVYQPLLMHLLAERRLDDFRSTAVRICRWTSAIVATLIAAEAIALDFAIRVVVGEEFAPAARAIIILTLPVMFVVGVSLWVWPLLVFTGGVELFVGRALLAVLVGQYGLPLIAVWMGAAGVIDSFATGYLLYYLILYSSLWRPLRQLSPAAVPTLAILTARRVI